MKRFALRGLVVISIVVALCMFFAGTVRTMTTPKIKIITPKQGKLEQNVKLSGKINFGEGVEVRRDDARNYAMLVNQVRVRPGYQVKKGDVLFTMTMTDYDEKMEKLRADYVEKSNKLDDLDISNRELKKSSQRNSAYRKMLEAHDALVEKRVALRVLSAQEGIDVLGSGARTSSIADWAKEHGASPALVVVAGAYAQAKTASERAESNLYALLADKKTKGKDGSWDYLKQRGGLIDQMAVAEEEMTALTALRASLKEVTAPDDGYILSVAVKQGENYDGKGAALMMSTPGVRPTLRADVSEVRKNIQTGAAVTIKNEYSTLSTTVLGVGLDVTGKKYVDVDVTDEMIDAKGGIYGMTLSDTEMTVTFRAAESTTLLPASAVRSEGGNDRFVYVVRDVYGGFSESKTVVEKVSVTLVAEAGNVVSIAEDMINDRVADKEDRAIKDGDAVMEYVT